MKRHFKAAFLTGLGAVMLGISLLQLLAGTTTLKMVPGVSANPSQLTLKLQVQSTSNSVIYVIQTSTNLVQWDTLVSGRTKPGAVIQLGDVVPTSPAKFYRLTELPAGFVDTNPPAWTNGAGVQFTLTPPSGVTGDGIRPSTTSAWRSIRSSSTACW